MAAAEKPKTYVVSGEGRLSYAHLHEPTAVQGSDKLNYNTAFMWPKTDTATTAKMQGAFEAALLAGTPKCWADAAKARKGKTFSNPIYDGDDHPKDDPNYAGMWYINCKSAVKPDLMIREGKTLRRITDAEKAKVYSGAFAKVSVNFFPFNKIAVGVGVGLNGVLVTGGGEPFGASSNAFEDFAEEGDVTDFAEEADFDPEA